MRSPFPGMDPWLERHWGDVHASFIVYLKDQLNQRLPSDLQARVEESVCVDYDENGESRILYPNVRVVEREQAPSAADETGAVATAVELAQAIAVAVRPQDEPITMRHLEIRDRTSGDRVITAIEVLRPADKTGNAGSTAYLDKQRDYFQARVNLVEIDLLRGGRFVVAAPEKNLPARCRTPYRICVRRVTRFDVAHVYPVSLRQPLPNIAIPLRPMDDDIVLELQPALDDCYRRGRYDRLDYGQALDTPLSDDDAAWASSVLRSSSRV
jgi:hypothetical protein